MPPAFRRPIQVHGPPVPQQSRSSPAITPYPPNTLPGRARQETAPRGHPCVADCSWSGSAAHPSLVSARTAAKKRCEFGWTSSGQVRANLAAEAIVRVVGHGLPRGVRGRPLISLHVIDPAYVMSSTATRHRRTHSAVVPAAADASPSIPKGPAAGQVLAGRHAAGSCLDEHRAVPVGNRAGRRQHVPRGHQLNRPPRLVPSVLREVYWPDHARMNGQPPN